MTKEAVRLDEFMGRAIQELSAGMSMPLVLMGEKLGLYAALAGQSPLTPSELATRTGTDTRYVREWLCAQAAAGYVTLHPEFELEERFSLPDVLIPALVDPDSPYYLLGSFQVVSAAFHDEPTITEAFRTGRGVAWGEHNGCLFCGSERFYRASYLAYLINDWIPALQGVVEKLERGAAVADIGCGFGSATILMAQAFPKSTFIGYDNHESSIEIAQQRAQEAGVVNRVQFVLGQAQDYPSKNLDLVTLFDCLHDMGDPIGAVSHIRQTLAPDGTVMVVEPFANDRIADNLTPVGRSFYSGSTLFCTPSAKAQPGGMALGAQAGEARLRDVLTQGGLSWVCRAATTPFNLVLEARL